MADIDVLPQRGVHPLALVGANGIAIGGSATVAQLAAKGMQAICQVDQAGIASSDGVTTVAQLASRGIRAFAAVDELGVSTDDAVTKADTIRMRGIRPMVAVDANGVSQTGTAKILTLAQRGLGYFCPVDETGTAGSLIPVPPNTIRARVGIFAYNGEDMTPVTGYVVTAQVGTFPLAGVGTALTPPAPSYQGPGDVAGWGTAYGYWGLRAYNASKIGVNTTKCLDVCSNPTGAALNLTTVYIGSDGYVDLSGIGFSPIYINRIYDQVGSQDLFGFSSGGYGRSVITTNAVGGKPAINFDGNGNYYASTANATALSQTFTIAGVIKFATNTFSNVTLTEGSSSCWAIFHSGTANKVSVNLGVFTDNTATAADNVLHSIITVAQNAATTVSVDVGFGGARITVAGGVGANNFPGADKLVMGAGVATGGALMFGQIYEIILKAGGVSTANQDLLTTNQHAIGTGW